MVCDPELLEKYWEVLLAFFLTFWAAMFVCCLSFALMMLLFSNFYSFNINIDFL
ncbi:MAG: hypothetical protein Q8823_02220 [Candidatus Phytoplasma australasiaticum]|nr:hypothetical protein [Candidatus Phytoplasma australasiaticum]